MYIYIEYLLIENIIVNLIILYVTKGITRTETSKFRIFIAALIGSLYTLVAFFPPLQFMVKFSIKFSISVLMIILAFNPARLKLFLKQISAFYMVSFAFAGSVIGIFYILNNSLNFTNFSFNSQEQLVKFLVIGIALAIILIKYILSFHRGRFSRERCITNMIIELNDQKVELLALIDTGNSLKEPISQLPVVIVEYGALKGILPGLIRDIYSYGKELDLDIMIHMMEKVGEEISFRLIPFKSIGNDNGILIGFKPDRIRVNLDDELKELRSDIVVAIYNDRLAEDEEYRGLLHPEILG
ncbi:MAG TPA: sigma-E processing peptidase SpoIIGA [Tepidimicrobium sp.]|nr:sigma-E processing peptidase SpoIIGA [Tepidimicrobium sp.]